MFSAILRTGSVKGHSDPMRLLIYSVEPFLGFATAPVIFAGIREQLNITKISQPMCGVPIALICAGLLAMAFMGFAVIKIV